MEVELEGLELVGYEASFDFCSEIDSNFHADHQMKFLMRTLNLSQKEQIDYYIHKYNIRASKELRHAKPSSRISFASFDNRSLHRFMDSSNLRLSTSRM